MREVQVPDGEGETEIEMRHGEIKTKMRGGEKEREDVIGIGAHEVIGIRENTISTINIIYVHYDLLYNYL